MGREISLFIFLIFFQFFCFLLLFFLFPFSPFFFSSPFFSIFSFPPSSQSVMPQPMNRLQQTKMTREVNKQTNNRQGAVYYGHKVLSRQKLNTFVGSIVLVTHKFIYCIISHYVNKQEKLSRQKLNNPLSKT